ncbi:MAG TPA: hypothetical protein VH183_11955 [Burkholderiaceae bacterium]|nr:hypothetical protein [Burkholderiaceae bacterium]
MKVGSARAGAGVCGIAALLVACSDSDQQADREHPIVTAPRIALQNGRSVVRLNADALQRAAIRTETVRRGAQPETVRAFATVLDLQPLAQLSALSQAAGAQLKAAQARLDASHAEYERERQLFEDQQNVSAAHVQAAQAAFLADQAAREAAQAQVGAILTSARLGWGPVVAGALAGSDPQQRTLADDLVSRRQLLLQVTLPSEWSDARAPPQGRVGVDGREGPSIQLVSPAAHADPRVAGRSFLYRAPPDAALLPGASVTVLLPTGRTLEAAVIPGSALVWWQGRAWVFVRTGTGDFERREIALDRASGATSLQVDLESGADVVVQGAQMLLSEELRAENFSTDVGGR